MTHNIDFEKKVRTQSTEYIQYCSAIVVIIIIVVVADAASTSVRWLFILFVVIAGESRWPIKS